MAHIKKNVAEMRCGDTALVSEILDTKLMSTFLERGVAPDTPIRCNFKGPMGCPICVRVSGCNLTLRLSEAALISIREKNVPQDAKAEDSTSG